MTMTGRFKAMTNKSSASRHDHDLLLPREVFRRIIDRERDRANRTGEIFSLVVFVVPESKEAKEPHALLADAVSQRMRSIDAVGWLDLKHVGVLLPETESVGAHKFVKKIYEEVQHNELLSNYEVFTYPSVFLTDPENIPLSETSGYEHKTISHWGGWGFANTQQNVDYIFCLAERLLKRSFDVLGASFLLLFLSPIFILVSIVIKISSPGPVFFKQQRVGYGGQPFTFLKFRTMCQDADTRDHQDHVSRLIKSEKDDASSAIPMYKLDHDPQIIPLGNLLRISCLDELPQLVNVLRGEMSLVGPRPDVPYAVKEYFSWHWGRFDAIPGITGMWQVSGKNKLSFREMVRLDIRYIRERTLWLDIKILFRTPLAIIVQIKDSLKSKNPTIEEGA